MRSLKFYDNYTLILVISSISLLIFEVFWIKQRFKGEEFISLTFNLILVGIFLVFYIIYSLLIVSLSVKMRDKYGISTKHLLMNAKPQLALFFYIFELRNLLKRHLKESKVLYS